MALSRNDSNKRGDSLRKKPGETSSLDTPGDRGRQIRLVLIVAAIAAAVLACAFGIATCSAADEASIAAHQQAGGSVPQEWAEEDGAEDDPLERNTPTCEVPNLAALLGKDLDSAVAEIGYGAAVRNDMQVETKSPTREGLRSVTVALADVRSKDGMGAPKVMLELDDEGRVTGAVYSAALRMYGFSNKLTFVQAIDDAHVVQAALADAGVQVAPDAVRAPADPKAYSTYNDDGSTLVREHAYFAGQGAAAGQQVQWTAALDYDYEEANETGNLVYTHRVLSVGVAPLL